MRGIAALIRNPLMIALVMGLAIAGCANKKTPNSAADLGLGGAATPGSAQDFTVNVGDRIFFDTDSSVIRADAQGILSRQAQWLNQYKQYGIVIEGHADERGTREYNLALGARRAAATRSDGAERRRQLRLKCHNQCGEAALGPPFCCSQAQQQNLAEVCRADKGYSSARPRTEDLPL